MSYDLKLIEIVSIYFITQDKSKVAALFTQLRTEANTYEQKSSHIKNDNLKMSVEEIYNGGNTNSAEKPSPAKSPVKKKLSKRGNHWLNLSEKIVM